MTNIRYFQFLGLAFYASLNLLTTKLVDSVLLSTNSQILLKFENE